MNYRKLFKEHYHIEFDKSWEVHHIDLNHENNEIDNLMLMPKRLHNEYHKTMYDLNPLCSGNYIQLKTIAGENWNVILYNESLLDRYFRIMKEIAKYTEFMKHLKTRGTNKEYPDIFKIGKEQGVWLL